METWTLTLDEPDRHGREQVRTVSLTIDIRDYKERAGFALLVMAANPHLSAADIQAVLANVDERHERSLSWIKRRLWLFRGRSRAGARKNADGLDDKAREIMRQFRQLSGQQMVYVLRENGIYRSREWVRQNRVDN